MKKISLLIFILSLTLSLFGQNKNEGRRQEIEEKIKSLKVGYFTTKLELTSSESEKFWPIFNQYEAEKLSLFNDKKGNFKNITSDNEGAIFIKQYFELKEKELNIEKKYSEKFKSAISVKKIAQMFMLEKNFRQEIMSNIIDKRKERSKK